MDKSYYAIIPASVRYDKNLSANSKLLYGEITALCNEKGYCWANNAYFSHLYQVSNRTITNWVNELKMAQHVVVNYEKTDGYSKRYIMLSDTNVFLKGRVRKKISYTT